MIVFYNRRIRVVIYFVAHVVSHILTAFPWLAVSPLVAKQIVWYLCCWLYRLKTLLVARLVSLSNVRSLYRAIHGKTKERLK
jgi:hypothetical protein